MSEPARFRDLLRSWADAVRPPTIEPEEPHGPAALSIWDPIHLGVDEHGHPVRVTLAYRNALLAGEPGAGKSVGLNLPTAHAALSVDCSLWLFDGKLVELGLWRPAADRFVGNDLDDAIGTLRELQAEMDFRYDRLDQKRRRKITPADAAEGVSPVVAIFDELAYYSATVGTKAERETFSVLVRDLIARGRAAGIIVIAATQRPSADIIPTSLRDLFGYRWAFRCTTDASSDIILGHGWASRGHSAGAIAPEDKGVGLLLAEGGEPQRIKSAYLSDEQVYALADTAAALRADRATDPREPHGVKPMTGNADTIRRQLDAASTSAALANHATYREPITLTDAYDVVGTLHELVTRLPQLVRYLARRVELSDPSEYFADRGTDPATAIAQAAHALALLVSDLDRVALHTTHAHNALGHLGRIDPGD